LLLVLELVAVAAIKGQQAAVEQEEFLLLLATALLQLLQELSQLLLGLAATAEVLATEVEEATLLQV